MFTKHDDNLSIHKQNDHLLFQFFLSELFVVFQEKKELTEKYQELELCLARKKPALEIKKLINELAHATFTLIDATEGAEYASAWIPHRGCLGKLNHYAHHLTKRLKPHNIKTSNLLYSINQSLHYTLQATELLQDLIYCDAAQVNLQSISQLIDKFNGISYQINLLPEVCIHLITEYFHDENVLFFLLRHKDQLENLNLSQFLIKIIDSLFNGSIDHLKTSLIGRYSKRQFNHLADILDEKIDEYFSNSPLQHTH